MCIELKIKSKSLAEEAQIIRIEEARMKRRIEWHKNRQMDASKFEGSFHNIANHRRWDVRNEARATYLARAYLNKRPYSTVETPCKNWDRAASRKGVVNTYVLPKVHGMVKKYGDYKTTMEDIKSWMGTGSSTGGAEAS